MSKSTKKGAEHENDKNRCQKMYQLAVKKTPALQSGGPYFYDRQASLYTLSQLKTEGISFTETEGVSRRPNFVRAEFLLQKVTKRCSRRSTSSYRDRPSRSDQNVVTIGACIHYLIDPTGVDVPNKIYKEGALYSGIGASKSVKTLEGTNKNEPSAFITTEMKSTVFHPDYWPLFELFKTYTGFKEDLKANSFLGQRMERACVGLQVFLDFGENKGLGEDGTIMEIRGFHTSAKETIFKLNGEDISVFNHFKQKYAKTLDHPDLFTIEAKGKGGKVYLPAELLILCPSQVVTNDQMINNEQADMIRISAAKPHVRKSITDTVARRVGLASNNVYGVIKVEDPIKLEGLVLNKPRIVFAGNKTASLPNPRGVPTDFNRAGNYAIAKELKNWEVVFNKKEEVVDGFVDILRQEMKDCGMNTLAPEITIIGNDDLETVFKKAKAANRQLLFFVIYSGNNYHQKIKALEQKYDVLTQEVKAETAKKIRQPQTRLNIVNKTNMKLGGLNYEIRSESFGKPQRIIVGFETSQRSGGNPDYPISVGFAANMLKHHQQFAGGYVYVERNKDVFGPIIKNTLITILQTANANRSKPNEILIYFNGVSEGQFSLLNETYKTKVEEACAFLSPSYKPDVTIIASSKMHNERLYKSENGSIVNLEPGTVIDHTIVSPVYNEWFHASAVARQGTTKTTKFTLIYTTNPAETMSNLEELTNDLCYDHQVVFQPVGLPVPLYIAGRYSQRGSMVLAENKGPIYKGNEVDLGKTNQVYGYGSKKLFNTRFNA